MNEAIDNAIFTAQNQGIEIDTLEIPIPVIDTWQKKCREGNEDFSPLWHQIEKTVAARGLELRLAGNDLQKIQAISTKDEYISFGSLQNRKYWTAGMIPRLVGDPDEIQKRADGGIRCKLYKMSHVYQAEQTEEFQARKTKVDGEQLLKQTRRDTIKANLMKATKAGIARLGRIDIPQSGTLDEVYAYCRNEMTEFQSLESSLASLPRKEYVQSCYEDAEIRAGIYKKIAESRLDLAFECGRKYETHWRVLTFG